MNERIKQLVEQAKAYATDSTKDYTGDEPIGFMDYYTEKFAELILLDLINTINDIRTANACVFTTFDKSITDCVKVEIIKLIETTYGIKE